MTPQINNQSLILQTISLKETKITLILAIQDAHFFKYIAEIAKNATNTSKATKTPLNDRWREQKECGLTGYEELRYENAKSIRIASLRNG